MLTGHGIPILIRGVDRPCQPFPGMAGDISCQTVSSSGASQSNNRPNEDRLGWFTLAIAASTFHTRLTMPSMLRVNCFAVFHLLRKWQSTAGCDYCAHQSH